MRTAVRRPEFWLVFLAAFSTGLARAGELVPGWVVAKGPRDGEVLTLIPRVAIALLAPKAAWSFGDWSLVALRLEAEPQPLKWAPPPENGALLRAEGAAGLVLRRVEWDTAGHARFGYLDGFQWPRDAIRIVRTADGKPVGIGYPIGRGGVACVFFAHEVAAWLEKQLPGLGRPDRRVTMEELNGVPGAWRRGAAPALQTDGLECTGYT